MDIRTGPLAQRSTIVTEIHDWNVMWWPELFLQSSAEITFSARRNCTTWNSEVDFPARGGR